VIAATPTSILAQALIWLREGHGVVLATLTGFEGSTSRAIGTIMAVADHGAACGSISSGCLEDAIIAEAREVMRKGHGRVTRYGTGSPYIDIRLPCGGGIDLLYTPLRDPDLLDDLLRDLHHRRPAHLHLSPQGAARHGGSTAGSFTLPLTPDLRLVLFGQGDEFLALARLGVEFGARIDAFSPLERDILALEAQGIAATRLLSTSRRPMVKGDPWSAVAFLFHERDWEDALLPDALALPAFYHGAVGSARTHAGRLERLAAQSVSPDLVARLRGRIGLIPSTRDPASLALSILAQIVQAHAALPARMHEAAPA
jgi:xanthine dehydrogenase accessory factor